MNKVVIFDSIDVEAAVNNMAFQLNVMLKGQTAVLVPVMIGGLYTAMKIADRAKWLVLPLCAGHRQGGAGDGGA